MISADEIAAHVRNAIPGAEIDVADKNGDGQYWRVVVRAAAFHGLSLLDQHKMVMGSLQNVIGTRMHAVEIKTVVAEDAAD